MQHVLLARLLAGVHRDVLVHVSRRHCSPKAPTTQIQINMAIAISCDCQPCRHLVLTMLVVRLNKNGIGNHEVCLGHDRNVVNEPQGRMAGWMLQAAP